MGGILITNKEYATRRSDLMSMMGPNTIAVVTSAPERIRSRDTYHRYKQDTTLTYLSGFPEAESVLVLIPNRDQGEFILFCREKDEVRETWDGFLNGPDGARKRYAADDAFPISDLDDILPGMLEGKDKVYYGLGKYDDFDKRLMQWVKGIRNQRGRGSSPPGEFVDLDHFVNEMRLIKSSSEIKLMRRAGAISASAHRRAMSASKPGMYEYQLQAEIEHEFMIRGASCPAYSTIVGGGGNGCILHYIDNKDKLLDGDLVLIDAGCEYRNYAGDITRTFPVNGRFTSAQAAIYDLVLSAQSQAIEVLAPGISYDRADKIIIRTITQGLIDLGILDGELEELIDTEAHRQFYMHNYGHWLGMDVHDVGDYKIDKTWREYESGMVLTVEPGIYISASNMEVQEKWRGLAVRIEDNLLITKTGCEQLTSDVPKTREEIEILMSE